MNEVSEEGEGQGVERDCERGVAGGGAIGGVDCAFISECREEAAQNSFESLDAVGEQDRTEPALAKLFSSRWRELFAQLKPGAMSAP